MLKSSVFLDESVGAVFLLLVFLQYLYLEGNQISDLPDSFFISLPRLLWLDLRNNQIPSLPAQIGSHRLSRPLKFMQIDPKLPVPWISMDEPLPV